MLTMVRITREDTRRQILIPADSIKRIEPKEEADKPGCTVVAPEAGGQFKIAESALEIAQAIAHAIQWKETRVVQGQLDAAAQIQSQQTGLVLPRNNLNGN